MADTLPNVSLPAGTWVNLYTATGIAVGTQIIVQNICNATVRVATKATAPLVTDGHNIILPGQEKMNPTSASGAWAFCKSDGGVNVRAA